MGVGQTTMRRGAAANKRGDRLPVLLFSALLAASLALGGVHTMAETVVYRVAASGGKGRTIEVVRADGGLELKLAGFGAADGRYAVNGGGTSVCRTIAEHASPDVSVVLSLPIQDPRSRCRKSPGFVTVRVGTASPDPEELAVRRTAGTDSVLRRAIERGFGSIDPGER